jgi:hypothetical protein
MILIPLALTNVSPNGLLGLGIMWIHQRHCRTKELVKNQTVPVSSLILSRLVLKYLIISYPVFVVLSELLQILQNCMFKYSNVNVKSKFVTTTTVTSFYY